MYAEGTTSPSNTTNIEDIRTAAQSGTIKCMNIGKDSLAVAFDMRRVDNSKWCYSKTGSSWVA